MRVLTSPNLDVLMTPYTNTSWWFIEPKRPKFEREGDAPLLRLRNGVTNLENYSGNKWLQSVFLASSRAGCSSECPLPNDVGAIKRYIETGGIVWATGGYPFFIQHQQQADGSYKSQSVGGGNAAVLDFSCATTPVEDPAHPLSLTADGKAWLGEERSKRLETMRADVQRSYVTTAYQEKLIMGGSDCFVGGIRCDGWGYFFSAGGFIPPQAMLSEIITGTVLHLYNSSWNLPRESTAPRCWKLAE